MPRIVPQPFPRGCGYKAQEPIDPDSRMITSVDVVPGNASEEVKTDKLLAQETTTPKPGPIRAARRKAGRLGIAFSAASPLWLDKAFLIPELEEGLEDFPGRCRIGQQYVELRTIRPLSAHMTRGFSRLLRSCDRNRTSQ